MASGYYPPGAENDPSAPYNEVEIRERDFDIDVEFVMRKSVTVTTNDYQPYFEIETGHIYADTENTDWGRAYNESGHYTIGELLAELKNYLEQDLERYKGSRTKERHIKEMIESCESWETAEANFER